MTLTPDYGRVLFPGNPWPDGHRIVECVWSARIERSTGVWADFHVESEPYCAADQGRAVVDEDPDDDPTASRTLWYNHHAFTLSSTQWPGTAYGFQLGSRDKPFNYHDLSGATFEFDDPPAPPGFPRPFVVYRWGHEDVAFHRVTVERKQDDPTFSIAWRGMIGDADWNGAPEFTYPFEMRLRNVVFRGIVFLGDVSQDDVCDWAEPYVLSARRYRFEKHEAYALLTPT